MKFIKRCSALIIAAVFFFLICSSAFAAEKTDASAASGYTSAVELFNDPDGRTVGVCRRGMWHDFPENSLEAICAAAETGIDFVMSEIKISSDGVLFLFADKTSSRMLNTAEDKAVEEMTWQEISSYNLKDGAGGKNSSVTEYKACSLESALKTAKEQGFCIMPKTDASLADEVYALIKELDMLNDVCIYIEGSKKEVLSIIPELQGLNFITGLKSNIVFIITSYIDTLFESGAKGVNLMTINRYGVNFNQTVLKHFNGTLRAVAAPAESETCGAREDTVKWWDDLISRGYSVIITDEPELFTEYLNDGEKARQRLENVFEQYTQNWKLPSFKSYIFNDYKKAYNDAFNECSKLINDKSASVQDLNDAAAALQSAADNINAHYEELEQGTAGMTVTLPRILLCVVFAVVVIAVQVFFFKKRKKN